MSGLATPAAEGSPRSGEVQDAELVRRVRSGDDAAFEALYHRYHRRITAYIHGMVHDHGRAEDVAQDVFVSALRRMRETERPIAFKPWIYEIAKNACIDQFRRSRRAEEVSYDADEGLGAADYGRLVSSDAMPEDELESKTNLHHLRGAFGGLSDTHHEILVMRELEGLSYREIGDKLGMSRPSVESTLFRARRRLTEEYEELVSGARCQRIQAIIATAVAVDLGARDQRRLARHVSHCQPCRRQARLAGLQIPISADQPVRARIAALLPLPLFLRRRWLGLGDDGDTTGVASSHAGSFATWSAQLGSTVDPSWLKAAATAATIAVAGAGATVATHSASPQMPAGNLSQVVSGLGGSSSDGGASAATSASAHRATPPATRSAVTTVGRRHRGAGATTTAAAPAAAVTTSAAAAPATAAPTDQAATQVGKLADGTKQAASGTSAPSAPAAPPASPPSSAPAVSAPAATVPSVAVAAPDATAVTDATNGAQGTVTTAVGSALGH